MLHAEHLCKTYDMGAVKVHALRDASLTLNAGQFVVILGPSGSGKSTLLNILGGLDAPTSGRVVFEDRELVFDNDESLTAYRRNKVGFVFQFYNLVPSLTARENVALVAELSTRSMSAEEALAMVGLGERADHFPAQLSGGEQQRVAIARAVCKRPAVLFCDEPTGALDVQTGRQVIGVLKQVNETLGTLTAVITHNAAIADVADRVVNMAGGTITHERHNDAPMSWEKLQW